MDTGTKIIFALLGLGTAGGIAYALVSSAKPKSSPPTDTPGGELPGEEPGDEPGPDPGGQPTPNPVPKPDLGLDSPPKHAHLLGVLSRQSKGGVWCTVPVLPAVTTSYAGTVQQPTSTPADGLVWGWQPSVVTLQTNPANEFRGRFIAVLEPKATTQAGWSGGPGEVSTAEVLAGWVAGVSSAGWLPLKLRPVFAKFAAAGVTGYPRVVVALPNQSENKPGENPREKLNAALAVWRSMGFKRLVPVLEVFTGVDNLRELVDECYRLGLDFMFSSLQQIEQLDISCQIDNV